MKDTNTYLVVIICLLLMILIFFLFTGTAIADLLRDIKACQCGG